MNRIIMAIIKFFCCKILFRTEYKNIEILEKYPKCIVCANHSRIFDPAFLYKRFENMYTLAKADLFKNKFVANLLEYCNGIPIKRNSKDVHGVKKVIKLIKDKEKIRLLIFPEGGVYKENYLENKRKTKSGAVYIAATANLPIIPIYITSRPKFFSKVTITFGKPFYTNPEVLTDRKILKEEAKRLINYIYEFAE